MCTTLVCIATNIHFFAFRPREEAEVFALMPSIASRTYRPFLAQDMRSKSTRNKKDDSALNLAVPQVEAEPSGTVSSAPRSATNPKNSMESVTLNQTSLSENQQSQEEKPTEVTNDESIFHLNAENACSCPSLCNETVNPSIGGARNFAL